MAAQTNTQNNSQLQQKVGTQDLGKKVNAIGCYQQIMQHFINYITTIGAIPVLPAKEGVPASVTNAANQAITQLNTDFGTIQTGVSSFQSTVDQVTNVVTAVNTFARHGGITIASILDQIKKYKSDPASIDRSNLTSNLNTMVRNCKDLKTKVTAAQNSINAVESSLQTYEKTLNTDLESLQQAIPSTDGSALNLSTLTEAQAFQKLQSEINNLNQQASDLKSDIDWLTAGEVSTGVFGGLVAITNFWNPIGWVAGGATVAGEIEMAGKKAQDVEKLNTTMAEISLTQDEQAILHPIYAIKNATTQLTQMITAADNIGTVLVSMEQNFQDAEDDIDNFLNDVTNGVSGSDLESDAKYVASDYSELQTLSNDLLTPMQSRVVSVAKLENVKPI